MIDSRTLSYWSAQLMIGMTATMAIASFSLLFADDDPPSGSVAIKLTLVPSTPEKPAKDPTETSPGPKDDTPPKPVNSPKLASDSVADSKQADASVVEAGSAKSQEPDKSQQEPQNILRSPSRLANDRPLKQLQLRAGTEPPAVDNVVQDKGNEAETKPTETKVLDWADQVQVGQAVPVDESAECPGAPSDKSSDAPTAQQDDLPLIQEEHPYDAPAGQPTDQPTDRPTDRPMDRPVKVIPRPDSPMHSADRAVGDRIARVLHHHMTHPENLSRRGPWAVMHAALPFGVEAEVIAGNRRVNALGWMCYNGVCAKQRMFQPTKTGFRTNVGAGVQGHEGQFLAILAQSRVQPDYPILIGQRRYTIMDLAKYEMATCREKSELTFKLIGLSHYLDANQHWRDNRGRPWNLEKLVAEELAQPVIGAACGGTHRLMGLSFALVRRQQAGLPLDGHWHRAEVFIQDFVVYTMSLQNPDGSFSTEWFEGRGNAADIERKLQTTGHILEWLVYTLPDEELHSPRIRSAIDFLLNTLSSDLDRDWPIGPRGHALRALSLYYQRLYGGEPGQMQSVLTAAAKNGTIR